MNEVCETKHFRSEVTW